MPPTTSYTYQAQTLSGQPVRGAIDAIGLEDAAGRLAEMQLRVLSLEATGSRIAAAPLSGEDFLAFNQQLAQLTRAGLPVERGLRLIAQDMRRGRLANALHEVAEELERGAPLPQAFEKHRGRFPSLYGRLIAAGIRMGNLPGLLLGFGRHLELVHRLRASLWRAASYPLMVLAALATVLVFLGLWVLPQFESLYAGFRIELPAVTRMVLRVADAMPAVLIALGVLVLALPLGWAIVRAAGLDAVAAERLLLPLPLIGPVLRRNLVARWCDALHLAVSAGLDLPAAIELAGDAVASPALRRDGQRLIDGLAAGQSLEAIGFGRILPATVAAAIALAGQHQDLPTALATLSQLYQQQAEMRAAIVPAVVSPLLLAVIAVMIAFVIIALLAPLVALLQFLNALGF